MNVKNDTAKSGAPVYLFEVKAPYETYLSGLEQTRNHQPKRPGF